MSRCFPYPPPGYEKSLVSIEPIKLQKESEKAKKDRKKEKKRGKEKKDKSGGDKQRVGSEKHGHKKKRHHSELSHSAAITAYSAKAREDDGEQLEKSSLTEERGGSAAVQSLCDSSDSTQNSAKKSKHEPTGVARITQGGNGLRIRLPLTRHKDTESPISGEAPCFSGRYEGIPAVQETKAVVRPGRPCSSADEKPCFSGGASSVPSEEHHEGGLRSKSVLAAEPPPPPARSSGPSRRHKYDDAGDSHRAHRSHRSGGRSHDRETRRLYKKLILEWRPSPLVAENPEDDEDWLFGAKTEGGRRWQQGERSETTATAPVEDAGLGDALCSWPPRACLIPDAGVYALPYVCPF